MTWDEVLEIVDFLASKGVVDAAYMTLAQCKKIANPFTLAMVRQYKEMEKANAKQLAEGMGT